MLLGAVATLPVATLPVAATELGAMALGTALPCLTAAKVRSCTTIAIKREIETAPPAVCPPNILLAA